MFMRMVYDEKLAQAAYVIGCQRTGEAIVIDPERDVDRYINLCHEHGMQLVATAETHIHADFLSGARELAVTHGKRVYLSDEGDENWKYAWPRVLHEGVTCDHVLLRHGDQFAVGNIEFRVLHTPGHTPEHIVFMVTDRGSGADAPIGMVSGDFVFVGDLGRPDLLETAAGQAGAMEPAARRLYRTVASLHGIPEFVQVWPGHGSGSACGKALGAIPTSTIGYERRFNAALAAAASEQQFVDYILSDQPEPPTYFARMKRDNKLGPPVLGKMPEPLCFDVDTAAALDGSTTAIVDTRPWEAFRSGHLPSSLSLPMIKSFTTDAGSFIGEDEPIHLSVAPEHLDEVIRDLVRIGLDNLTGWTPAEQLDPASSPGYSVIEEIDVDEARRQLEAGAYKSLDVRRRAEVRDGHVPGALNIAHTRLASRIGEIPTSQPLVVNCRSGVRSARSCSYLKRQGFEVVNVRGGFLAWEAAGAPIEQSITS